jgi:hypothetical protein
MSQPNSLLRHNLSDLAIDWGTREAVMRKGGDGLPAEIAGRDTGRHYGGHPIACQQGREGRPSTALGCWLLALPFDCALSRWFALLVDCEVLGAANSEQRSKEAGKDSAQSVARLSLRN